MFFEEFFKFNYENKDKSEANFNLKERFDLIFKIFGVLDIKNFNSKISLIKKETNLEDNLKLLNINVNKNSENILKGINLLRLGNNPVKIREADIIKIISSK